MEAIVHVCESKLAANSSAYVLVHRTLPGKKLKFETTNKQLRVVINIDIGKPHTKQETHNEADSYDAIVKRTYSSSFGKNRLEIN